MLLVEIRCLSWPSRLLDEDSEAERQLLLRGHRHTSDSKDTRTMCYSLVVWYTQMFMLGNNIHGHGHSLSSLTICKCLPGIWHHLVLTTREKQWESVLNKMMCKPKIVCLSWGGNLSLVPSPETFFPALSTRLESWDPDFFSQEARPDLCQPG